LYNPKCPQITGSTDLTFYNNVSYAGWVALALAYGFFDVSHWLFCFRYFEVAEMLGRKDKSNEAHLKARRITSKITIGMVEIIIL
jgi:hypothetical protein